MYRRTGDEKSVIGMAKAAGPTRIRIPPTTDGKLYTIERAYRWKKLKSPVTLAAVEANHRCARHSRSCGCPACPSCP